MAATRPHRQERLSYRHPGHGCPRRRSRGRAGALRVPRRRLEPIAQTHIGRAKFRGHGRARRVSWPLPDACLHVAAYRRDPGNAQPRDAVSTIAWRVCHQRFTRRALDRRGSAGADRIGGDRWRDARRFSGGAFATGARFLASSAHHSDAARLCGDADRRIRGSDRRQDSATRGRLAGERRRRPRTVLLKNMKLPQRVTMVEVGPRDGLQNEKAPVPTEIKVGLIDRLTDAGLPAIEATSFVSPKWVPQMADNAEVMARIRRKRGVRYPVLTPNPKGFEAALAAGCDEVAVFVAASETFSQKNINCGIAESLERAKPVAAAAKAHRVRVRGYISCVLGCPYEGDIAPSVVRDVAAALKAMGCDEVSLGDTIGTGTPGKTQRLLRAVAEAVPVAELAGHFHDTYGQALANVYAAMELGVATFDSSVAGLGGCPYAKGATGNVASEDVLYLLNGLDIETGVDMTRLRLAGRFICDFLGRRPASRVARALDAKEPLATVSPA